MANLTILGGGAWGSALANLATKKGHAVNLWSRRSSINLESVIKDADVAISAVSMKGVGATVDRLLSLDLNPNTIIVTVTKGLDPATTQTPSQIWQNAFPNNSVVVLSGPNLSEEIQQGLPAATVAASFDLAAAKQVQTIYSSEIFRVYVNQDPLGTELGGTLKNVFAIAAGICDGLQLGTNAKSALLTRALPEMMRVGMRLGAKAETFYGLSGLGDLLATCNSPLSRNYRVGFGLAGGKSLARVLEELQSTAEGVNTANVLIDLADRREIEVPVSRQVYRLLNGEITPQQSVVGLMERALKPEI
ncbi:MAG: NAD(P)H-dependent glycerol-3-phosphate dehydrogenase [Microcoleus sp.]